MQVGTVAEAIEASLGDPESLTSRWQHVVPEARRPVLVVHCDMFSVLAVEATGGFCVFEYGGCELTLTARGLRSALALVRKHQPDVVDHVLKALPMSEEDIAIAARQDVAAGRGSAVHTMDRD